MGLETHIIKCGDFSTIQHFGEDNEILWSYHKIAKISPGIYSFQRPFLRGLYSEGLIYGGRFAFQNRLG